MSFTAPSVDKKDGNASPELRRRLGRLPPETIAARARPKGYKRVKFGDLRASDLIWSCFTFEYLRHDDPGWDRSVKKVEECDYVVRAPLLHQVSDKISSTSKDGPGVLNLDPEPVSYQIRKTTIESWDQLHELSNAELDNSQPDQGKLF